MIAPGTVIKLPTKRIAVWLWREPWANSVEDSIVGALRADQLGLVIACMTSGDRQTYLVLTQGGELGWRIGADKTCEVVMP